jgi:lactate permease
MLGLKPMDAVVLGLFSQTMVPWGALAIPTIVGAGLSGLSPAILGTYSAVLTLPLLLLWLALFWRAAKTAGIPSSSVDLTTEFLLTLTIAVLLIAANALLGPEVAALAALGPLIAVRFLASPRSVTAKQRIAMSVGLPYVVLIIGLAGSRLLPSVNSALA